MELIRTFYSVYRDDRLVRRGIDRDILIAGLHRAWLDDKTNVHPIKFTNMENTRFDDVDLPRLIEAVNEEGVFKITQEDKSY